MPIKIVNMIPHSLSGETNQDSEPNIAVNPAILSQIAASAFTPDPMGGPDAPIYKSTDGGDTWSLNKIVPSAGPRGTGDITLRFAGTSNRMFASILDGASPLLLFEVFRTTNFASAAVMTKLESRFPEDQPYIQAATVMGGTGVGVDRVYIGVNDFSAAGGGKTATVEQSLDAGAALPTFNSDRLETRSTGTSGVLKQDGPQIRPAIHPDGTIYAAFYRWIASTQNLAVPNTVVITNAEAIVVRDDAWGTVAPQFAALKDMSDQLPGRRVATALSFPFNVDVVAAKGQERWTGDLSIAVDPRNSSWVYLVFATRVSGVYTLRVVRSLDRGVTWSAVLLSLPNGKNPAIAINSRGKVGLLHQQLNGSGVTQRWEYHFRSSADMGMTWSDTILCTALSQTPVATFAPYTGDYLHMMALGKDFYGIFSANNTPDLANFPHGVTYQRAHNFNTKKLFALDAVTEVHPSIDPFFVKITELDPALHSDFYVRDWTIDANIHDRGLEPSSHPVFYATSDVWNQRTNVAPTFVNDQPQNQDPLNNATNFAFARVSRNTSATSETVSVDFLVAEFGTGSPYVLVASTTVAFAIGQTSKIAKASWMLGPTSSTHLCLAAQISTSFDPLVTPGLSGHTPGWPTTDLLVINDNNKAQRNMSVHYGLSGRSRSTHFALIRSASKKTRDFELRLSADPVMLKSIASLSVLTKSEKVPFEPGATVRLVDMKPGEYRWIAVDMASFEAKIGVSLPLDLLEVVDGKVINGFRFAIRSSSATDALRELLLFKSAVFQRLQRGFQVRDAGEVLKATRSLIRSRKFSSPCYLSFLASIGDVLTKAVSGFVSLRVDKSLDVVSSLNRLSTSLASKDFGKSFGNHVTLLNKLDIAMTLAQKTKLSEQPVVGKARKRKNR